MLYARLPTLLLCTVLLGGCASSSMSGSALRSPSVTKMSELAFFRALEMMEQGDLSGAEPVFLALSQRYPRYSGPWTNLGLIAVAFGEDDKAIPYFEKAIAMHPGNVVAMTALGTLLYRRGDHMAALDWNQRAISIRPDDPEANLNLAVLYDKVLLQPDQALKHYHRYQTLTGDSNLAVAAWILELEQGDSNHDYKVVSQ